MHADEMETGPWWKSPSSSTTPGGEALDRGRDLLRASSTAKYRGLWHEVLYSHGIPPTVDVLFADWWQAAFSSTPSSAHKDIASHHAHGPVDLEGSRRT
ncbi:hypothetical protein BRADI_5g16625v3 [Brachypodium distachyon]|uniref:Uncharacterized protein n=1 Tax=Brachypodium distachyon TaxID=15368 RepID=A0A2K2CHQ4_BRADI|nr:hypothetical protein BRADI_5g16625v3 [Brachypodium distachyon]